ncbi:tRNA pseudouridine(38-40) synthase TruA [Paenisporosarcina sp. FSL H8-0542]|uniref:tRNA pseudouridine(38-40) synthase TruA n=1 Tax=unclassified Paenisporosarcina TaxID=2642018 RepID=UPI00034E2F9A|nr:tRNA pseudouridine(38-40) synthase TruA [Paenisporosarcina sp. HGH0030]EPD49553.1 tRNA pseudouridine(38-40) synthase [Paenisporosarcina sp. HGH0030]
MKRLKAIIMYDGYGFAGYQVQPNARTVQLELERVLTKMHKGTIVRVVASGRTDAGVHATGQVIHFDTDLQFPIERWQRALNVQLPGDIRVVSVEEVSSDFHARYGTSGKVYRYKWGLGDVESPFKRHYVVYMPGINPDIERMREAAQAFLGTHDFTSFCSARTEVVDRVRTIKRLELLENEHGELHMIIEGDGFLYNMVRIIAGNLWEVGIGRREPGDMALMLAAMDRKKAGKTAPAHGLYLESVFYSE